MPGLRPIFFPFGENFIPFFVAMSLPLPCLGVLNSLRSSTGFLTATFFVDLVFTEPWGQEEHSAALSPGRCSRCQSESETIASNLTKNRATLHPLQRCDWRLIRK